jgi:hypothetical protein
MWRFARYLVVTLLIAVARDAVAGPSSADLRTAQAVPLASPPAQLPTAAAKAAGSVFSENFPGAQLSKAWEVVDPNPENYSVEGGALIIVARSAGGFGKDKNENLFRLNQTIPDSNWVITVSFNMEVQTWREALEFGLRDDSKNYIEAVLYTWTNCCGSKSLTSELARLSSGQTTKFEVAVAKDQDVDKAISAKQPFSVRLTKEGHEYRAGVNFAGQVDNAGKPVWVETGSVFSLHPPKTFALIGTQWDNTDGESPFYVKSVTIEAPTK